VARDKKKISQTKYFRLKKEASHPIPPKKKRYLQKCIPSLTSFSQKRREVPLPPTTALNKQFIITPKHTILLEKTQ